MLDMTPIKTDARFAFAFVQGNSDVLVLCFSGVGNKAGVMPPFEFVKAATQDGLHSVLFISDMTRSWLSADGLLDEIVAQVTAVKERVKPKVVVAMGNSMGGFMALNLSRVMPVDVTIAFTPQFSAMPDDVPEETRWSRFREKIEPYALQRVEDLPENHGRHFVFHGGQKYEHFHWSRFPEQENLRHYIFPRDNHAIAMTLKNKELLGPIIGACIGDQPRKLRDMIRQAGGIWRNERTYQRCQDFHRYDEIGEM